MKMDMKKAFLMLICLMAGWANGVGAEITHDTSVLRVDSATFVGNGIANFTQRIYVTVCNLSNMDFEGYFYLFRKNNTLFDGQLNVRVAAGATKEVGIDFEAWGAGEFEYLVCADADGEAVLATVTTTFQPYRLLNVKADFKIGMMTQENGENVLYGNQVNGRIMVKNNEPTPYFSRNYMRLPRGVSYRIEKVGSSTEYRISGEPTFLTYELGPEATFEKEFSFDYDFNFYLEPNQKYAMIASYATVGGRVDFDSIVFVPKNGKFTYWTKDRQVKPLPLKENSLQVPFEAVAVDLRRKMPDGDIGLIESLRYGIDVSEAQPNCLFYQDFFNEYAGIGSGQIIVCEGEALNVNIDENHDFMCPMSFKARHAYFRFTPDCMSVPQPSEGSYLFETLVLPFDITYANLIDINASKKMAVIPNDTTEVTEPSPIFPYEENLLLAWQYIGDAGDSLTVSPVDLRTLRANYPYILSLRTRSCIGFGGEDTKVPATEPAVVKGQQFDFVGTTCARAATDTDYRYNTFSNAFYVMDTCDLIPPFRAFIDGSHATVAYDALKLPWNVRYWGPDAPTEATTVASERAAATDGEVYTLSGQHLGTADVRSLKPGLYIIGGRKVAIK